MDYQVWESPELAKKYLNGVRDAIPCAKEQLEVMMRLLKANQPEVRNFLDLGCGDGILAATILNDNPKAKGTLLDLSEIMLNAAQERLNSYRYNLTFIEFDYGNLNWMDKVKPQAPFDVIVSGFSIHHQSDERKKEIYQEIFNLLSPGGIFINTEHVAPASKWVEDTFSNYFIDELYKFEKSQGGERSRKEVAVEFYNRPDKAANKLAPVELQCNWLREIGYIDVDCYFKVFEMAVFGGRKSK